MELASCLYTSAPYRLPTLPEHMRTYETPNRPSKVEQDPSIMQDHAYGMNPLQEFIFLHAGEGILIVSGAGFLLQMNPATAAMLQISPEVALGRAVRETFRHNPQLVRLLSPGGPEQLDVRLPADRLATGLAADIEGERVILLNDITERYDLESRREALIKAISHDLRNPISAVGGYAELVHKFGDLNAQQDKFITRIRQTTNKLYELTATLVDLAWLEAGMPLKHIPVELIELTRAAMQELSYEARKNSVSIVNSIPDELPAVMGDPRYMKLVIYNLIDNAIRYSLNSGNVVIHAWHHIDKVFYTVADQGIGISEDDQLKIWDRMWRSADDRVRDIPGGGVGLCFVQTVIRRHGGEIEVESALDEGTTFTFFLPLTRGG